MPHTSITHRPETVQVRTTTDLKQLSHAPTNNDDLFFRGLTTSNHGIQFKT